MLEVGQIRIIQNIHLQEVKKQYILDKECGVCYKNFISLSFDDYQDTIDKVRIEYGEYVAIRFELEMSIQLCFSHRFVCLTCKDNNICFGCLTEITKHKTITYPDCEKIIIAKCPFCRTDKVIIPIGVLDDIKNH
jgi:hypothetical protein